MKKIFSEVALTAEKQVIVEWLNTILKNTGSSRKVSILSDEERICDILELLNSKNIAFNDLLKDSYKIDTCSQADCNEGMTFTLVNELVGYQTPVFSIYFIVTGASQYQWEHMLRPLTDSHLEVRRFETDFTTISYKGTSTYVHLGNSDKCVTRKVFEGVDTTPKTMKI